MVAVLEKRSFRDFDWLLAFLAVAIVIFGITQIYNAQPEANFWQKQIIGLAIALVAMITIAMIDYRRLIDAAPYLYGFGIFLLILVLIPGIGMKINGQQCWIKVPLIGQFQPSEFVKIPVVLMLARYYGQRKMGSLKLKEIAVGLGILAVPLFLIMLEPDAGQTLTYFPLFGAVLFLSAVKIRWVLISLLSVVLLAPLAFWVGVQTGKIKPYQVERIMVIVDPENADPRGFGYHTMQSIITVGQGKLTGSKAGAEYSQSTLKFLPEPHTDFIFAVTAEHTGFVGCISLLFAYILLLSRLIVDARESPDRTGMLVIMAITAGLSCQIFINVGMALGLLPVIGVPLPLMSAGLSAILATFIAIGFAISIRMRRFVN